MLSSKREVLPRMEAGKLKTLECVLPLLLSQTDAIVGKMSLLSLYFRHNDTYNFTAFVCKLLLQF